MSYTVVFVVTEVIKSVCNNPVPMEISKLKWDWSAETVRWTRKVTGSLKTCVSPGTKPRPSLQQNLEWFTRTDNSLTPSNLRMVHVESHIDYTVTRVIDTAPLLLLQFIMLTYIFMLAWLGVTAFTSLPVFIYFNIWNICQNATVLDGTTLCLDPRQYGENCLCFFTRPTQIQLCSTSHICVGLLTLLHLSYCKVYLFLHRTAEYKIWLSLTIAPAGESEHLWNTFIQRATSDVKSC